MSGQPEKAQPAAGQPRGTGGAANPGAPKERTSSRKHALDVLPGLERPLSDLDEPDGIRGITPGANNGFFMAKADRPKGFGDNAAAVQGAEGAFVKSKEELNIVALILKTVFLRERQADEETIAAAEIAAKKLIKETC